MERLLLLLGFLLIMCTVDQTIVPLLLDPPFTFSDSTVDSRSAKIERVFITKMYFLEGGLEVTSYENTWSGGLRDSDVILLNSIDAQGFNNAFIFHLDVFMIGLWDIENPENFGVYKVQKADVQDHFQLNILGVDQAQGVFQYNKKYGVVFITP